MGKFVQLYTLLSRYADLRLLLDSKSHQEYQDPNNDKPNKDNSDKSNQNKKEEEQCLICFDEECKDMVVLSPCSHVMCSTCYENWVRRRYQCPYCRYDFSQQSLHTFKGHSAWQVLEWQWDELEQDVNRFDSKLTKIWTILREQPPFPFSPAELSNTYVAMERTVPEFRDRGDFVMTA